MSARPHAGGASSRRRRDDAPSAPGAEPAPLDLGLVTVVLVAAGADVELPVRAALEPGGFRVVTCHRCQEAVDLVRDHTCDLALVDLAAADGDLARLRVQPGQAHPIPVIGLRTTQGTEEVVALLDDGADDCVSLPCEADELAARARAHLRRCREWRDRADHLAVGDLVIDATARRVTTSEGEVQLTPTLFRLLEELARHPGRVLSRRELLERVWGFDYLGGSRLVDMAVMRLRDKLGDDPNAPRYVETVRNVGYRCCAEAAVGRALVGAAGDAPQG